MPTSSQRVIAAIASIGITVGGAWLASTARSESQGEALTSFTDGLNITFGKIRNNTGNVIVLVFADRAAFRAYDVKKAVGYRELPAKQGTVTVQFSDLRFGPYAVTAFHDEDGNRDLNMDGERPTEGYATSGATHAYDTPTFASASLRENSTSITMYYTN